MHDPKVGAMLRDHFAHYVVADDAESLIQLVLPRFTGDNRERNQRLIDALQKLAAEKGVTASQLAIAWVLAKSTTIVPVIGARTRVQLAESLGALRVMLTPDEMRRIEEAIPASAVAGTRYDEHQMRILDSERSGNSNT